MSRYWYAFDETAPLGKFDPSSYRLLGNQELPGTSTCLTGSQICAIYVPSGGIVPDSPFSSNITQYITDSSATTSPYPTGDVKPYLYQRNS